MRFICFAIAICCLFSLANNASATFFYTGPANGDFFDEANWNDAADGSGSAPVGDPIVNSSSGAIAIDLVIDGDSVVANGQVDFGNGSLTINSGGQLEVTGAGNDVDFNTNSTFNFTDSTLIANGDVVLEGIANLSGGTVTSVTDDIEFQNNLTVNVNGTDFSSGDNTFFNAFSGSISNASFFSADRFGLSQNTAVVVTDTIINVLNGNGDVDDVFAAAGAGSSLTLLGNSQLIADTVEEGVDLIIGDSSTANLGGSGIEFLDNGSTITLLTLQASLQVHAITNDERVSIIDGNTGLSYSAAPSNWNIDNWNGLDAVTLQLIPEPSSVLLMALGLGIIAKRRKH